MANKKETAVVVDNRNMAQFENKEVSESAHLKDLLVGFYANNAIKVFVDFATKVYTENGEMLTEEHVKEVETATNGFTVVYTQPSADSVITDRYTLVSSPWNTARESGRKWYKVTQTVETALNVKRSYDSYIRFLDDKMNGVRRDALRRLKGLSTEELLAILSASEK